MTRRTLLLLYVLTTAIVVASILWMRNADRRRGGSVARPEVQAGEPAPPADVLEPEGRVEPEGEPDEGPDLGPPRLRGSVSSAETGAPLAAHVVHFTTLGAREAIDTGEDGSFELELDPDTWGFGSLVTASVRDARGKLLLRTAVLPDAEIELRVPAPVHLSGRLSCSPPLEYAGRAVTVYTSRADGTTARLYCGSGALDADGKFSIEILEPVRPLRYLLDFETGPGSSFLAGVQRADLVSGAGATIERQWAQIVFRAKAADRTPLPHVNVRVAADLSAGDLGIDAARTDERGRLTLPLATGRYTLCATLAGYAPYVDTFEVPPDCTGLGLDVELRPLGDADVLRGIVLSPIEEPVAGALVELRSAVPLAALAPFPIASVHTTGGGHFDLACDSRALLDLTAWHADHGVLERTGVTIDERRLRLKFDIAGSVRITVHDGETSAALGAPVQYFVVDGGSEVVHSGRASAPLRLEGLRPGPYEALVLGPGGATYGHAAFTIKSLSEHTLPLHLHLAHHVSGHLEDESGGPAAGVLVHALHPTWPEPVRSAWGTSVSAPDGSFTVTLGEESSASVFAGGARTVVSEGEPRTIMVSAR